MICSKISLQRFIKELSYIALKKNTISVEEVKIVLRYSTFNMFQESPLLRVRY